MSDVQIKGRRQLRVWLEELVDDLQCALWNIFTGETGGEYIFGRDYEWDDIFETLGWSPTEAVRAAIYGDVRFICSFVWVNGYGNLQSSEFLDDSPFDIDTLVAWFAENPQYLSNSGYNVEYEDADDDEKIVAKSTKMQDLIDKTVICRVCYEDPVEVCNKYFRSNWAEMRKFLETYNPEEYPYYSRADAYISLVEGYSHLSWKEAMQEEESIATTLIHDVMRSGVTYSEFTAWQKEKWDE